MDRRLEEAVRDLELNMISREELVMDPRFIYVDDRDGEIRIMALPVTAGCAREAAESAAAAAASEAETEAAADLTAAQAVITPK